jgi:hypothetical protein
MREKAIKEGREPELIPWETLLSQAKAKVLPSTKSGGKGGSSKSKSASLKSQSAMRRPVSANAGATRRVSVDGDSPEAIANSPEVVEFWERAQAANGL